jgi:hypothetical protein
MSSRINAVRSMRAIGVTAAPVAAIALLIPVVASAAGATTIYACVNKKSGAMRIVSAKAKCKRTEHKLSWGTTGPAGPAGAPGTPGAAGAPGANGVGADYSSFNLGLVALALSENAEIVVSKTIPAGNYFASAKTVVGGDAKSAVLVAVVCQLVDSANTPHFGEPTEAIDTSEWFQQLSYTGSGTEYTGGSTMEMQGQLTTTEPTTLALVCIPIEGTKEATVDALDAQVSALQTTVNR